MTDELLTVPDAARRLGITPDAVYRLCRSSALAHYRVGARGGRILIRERDLRRYLRGCRVEAATPKGHGAGRTLRYITV